MNIVLDLVALKTGIIGLFEHPWLREVLALGKKLIQKFDSKHQRAGNIRNKRIN